MLVWLGIALVLGLGLHSVLAAFLPEKDQGYFMPSIQLPSDATIERTLQVVRDYERYVASRPGLSPNQSILGFGFSGSGAKSALAYTMLEGWDHDHRTSALAEVALAQAAMANSREATGCRSGR